MKNLIKKATMVAVLSTFTMTQAHAFCAYNENQEGKNQVWYFMKDEKVAKEFLKAWEGSKLASSGVKIVGAAAATALSGAIAAASAGTAAPGAGPAAAAALAKATAESKAILDASKSLAEVLLNAMPSEGDVIVKSGGILSTAGLKIAQAILKVRWGKTIKAGDKACWNKKDVVKSVKYLKKTTDKAYWIVLTDNKDGTFTFAKLGSEGIDKGIVAK
tara:strand:+ start:67 stop:717 length:651 start_codon:yes stop_codon:yes gene_type:complete